jgi:catechol 2,3-dioxygenase-like lactoylglutathione lyase family enzyme
MQKLDHVAVQVSDLDVAISFYTDKLGMELLFRKIDKTHHEAFCFLQLEGANLELLQSLDDQNRPQPFSPTPIREPYCPHLAIATDDLDSLLIEWKKGEIPIVKGPLEIPDKVRWIYIHDPDNNIIEFVQWLSAAASDLSV